jgi:hypothetical protein
VSDQELVSRSTSPAGSRHPGSSGTPEALIAWAEELGLDDAVGPLEETLEEEEATEALTEIAKTAADHGPGSKIDTSLKTHHHARGGIECWGNNNTDGD